MVVVSSRIRRLLSDEGLVTAERWGEVGSTIEAL